MQDDSESLVCLLVPLLDLPLVLLALSIGCLIGDISIVDQCCVEDSGVVIVLRVPILELHLLNGQHNKFLHHPG